MIVSIFTSGLKKYFVDHIKNIINRLTFNKVFPKDCHILEINELEKKIEVIVDNEGKKSSLKIPKKIIGTRRDEDIFISKLIEKQSGNIC